MLLAPGPHTSVGLGGERYLDGAWRIAASSTRVAPRPAIMVYISGGSVTEKRSMFRLSIFQDIFWGIVNFIFAL